MVKLAVILKVRHNITIEKEIPAEIKVLCPK